jgi:hypothetical protein
MALTRVTQGVINPNENYDTHNINSTGIITATGSVSSGSSITATTFYGDGSNLTGVSGFGNAVSNDPSTGGNEIFKVSAILTIGAGTSMTVQSDEESGWNMFTRARDIHVGAGATLHIASATSNGSVGSGTTFKTNIMGLSQGLF